MFFLLLGLATEIAGLSSLEFGFSNGFGVVDIRGAGDDTDGVFRVKNRVQKTVRTRLGCAGGGEVSFRIAVVVFSVLGIEGVVEGLATPIRSGRCGRADGVRGDGRSCEDDYNRVVGAVGELDLMSRSSDKAEAADLAEDGGSEDARAEEQSGDDGEQG